jgi:aryl-alcohol dehydrogenase-like predicted oxidoreductase
MKIHRREALKIGVAAAACASVAVAAESPLLAKRIPKSGERLPVIGVGTNNYSPSTPEERAARKEVLQSLTRNGAKVIDTAPAYRESERVIGALLAELGNRDQAFIATKVTAASGTREEGAAMLEESFARLQTKVIDLVQVHNLIGTAVLLPLLRERVTEKRIRYLGVTTWTDTQYAELATILRRETLDFVQLDYSIGNRGAAEELLPIAADRGVAVLVNVPFGGRRAGNLFSRVRGVALPDWAKEFDVTSWGQFFLKYVVSHPAVTCAIPGMTQRANLEDNLGVARGRLPDAALRTRMEAFWDALPA